MVLTQFVVLPSPMVAVEPLKILAIHSLVFNRCITTSIRYMSIQTYPTKIHVDYLLWIILVP